MREDRKTGFYSEAETQTPEERSARQWDAVQKVLAAGWKAGGEFKARMDEAGLTPEDIKTWDDWVKIPPFSKKDLIAFQQAEGVEKMLSCDIGALSRVYMSPGPIFDPEGRCPDYWGWAEGFFAAGFREKDLVQMTFGYHLTPAGLMLEEPLRELGCAVIPAGPGNTDAQLELMTNLPVTGFVGMASYLKIIKDKARAKGVDIGKTLEVAFVAAERLAPSLQDELEEELDMRVRQGYGTADIGCAAYECQELTGMHLSSRCLVEIVDPKTGIPVPDGETGEVVVTPFTDDYPLVRLGTGDLSYLVTEPCPCGRTSARLGGIVGRVDMTAKVKGQFIYPHQVGEVAAEFAQISAWQVVVSNPGGRDNIAIRLVLEGELDQERFIKAFQAKCKLNPTVMIEENADAIEEGAPALVDERTYE